MKKINLAIVMFLAVTSIPSVGLAGTGTGETSWDKIPGVARECDAWSNGKLVAADSAEPTRRSGRSGADSADSGARR